MLAVHDPFPNQCIPFYWAHLELEKQQSAEVKAGRDVLREALQGFSAQTDSCMACLGLFIFQTQLLSQGKMQLPAQLCLLLPHHVPTCVMKARRHGRGERPSAKEEGSIMPR